MAFRILKGFIRFLLIIGKTRWLSFFKLYDRHAAVILWIPPKGILYFIGDSIIWDAATINAFIENKTRFRIFYGRKVGKLSGKTIFHTVNNAVNLFGFYNYTNVYQHVLSQLQEQGNMVFPNLHEVNFWENKGYMHQQFKALGVSEPVTTLYNANSSIDDTGFKYPFLVKTEHSCSAKGVYKISGKEEFERLTNSPAFKLENKLLIKQELVDMRSDLRVILVGNEIVHHYWRINQSAEWKPTSTSYGSKVDFDSFPEQWRSHILQTFKSLQLSAGAFDITWDKDDLNNEPLYLEVSPVFQPNPKIALNGKDYAYHKKSFSPFNQYDREFLKLVFAIKNRQFKYCMAIKS